MAQNVLGNLVVQLSATTSVFSKSMGEARALAFTTSEGIVASLKTVESQLARLKFGSTAEWTKSASIVTGALAGIGVAAAVAAVSFAKSTADQALQLNKLSATYGISIEALTGLRVASQMTGVSMESIARGMNFLDAAAVKAVSGNKAAAQAFNQLGISVKDLSNGKGGMIDQIPLLLLVADHYSKLKDGVLKVAEAKALMGRAGPDEIALLNKGAAAIQGYIDKAKDMGLVMTAEDIAAALRFHETLEIVDLKVEAVKQHIAIRLIPALNDLADAFTGAEKTGEGWNAVGEAIGGVLIRLSAGFRSLGYDAEYATIWLKDWAPINDKLRQTAELQERVAAASRKMDEALWGSSQHGAGGSWGQGKGTDRPVIPTGAGTNKAAEEQFRQMESLLKSMRADWGLTLAEEASFWDQMLVPAKKYADNLRKVTDEINTILGQMREETRKLTEKLFGTLEYQLAYKGTGIQPPMATYGEAGKMFNEEEQKNENQILEQNNKIVEEIIRKQKERVSVYDALRMPMEQLAEYQERLNVDYHNGTIDGETWARAMADASDNIKGMYDPTVKLEKEIKALNEAYAAGLIGLSNYTKQLKQLQAEQSMARLTTSPQPGFGGVGQGIGAGLQSFATQWQGLPAQTGQAMVKVAGDMQNAFATAFQSMILGTKTVGQDFAQMGVSLLSDLDGTLMQMLAQWMMHFAAVHLLHLTSSAIDTATDATAAMAHIGTNVMVAVSDAAVAAANTLAECPWPLNMAMAPAVLAQGLAYAGMAAAERGALLDRDMPIFAHSKEMILPAYLSQHVLNTAGGGNKTMTSSFSPTIHIYGATDAQAVSDQVMSRVRKFFRTGGVMK